MGRYELLCNRNGIYANRLGCFALVVLLDVSGYVEKADVVWKGNRLNVQFHFIFGSLQIMISV